MLNTFWQVIISKNVCHMRVLSSYEVKVSLLFLSEIAMADEKPSTRIQNSKMEIIRKL